tara:strand:- start:2573 stop:2674 length:102 start_codon:yes stop_codon:yes gene_type:complete
MSMRFGNKADMHGAFKAPCGIIGVGDRCGLTKA